jgi:hypothetical protein
VGVCAEVRAKWCFGTAPSGESGAVLGATGTGTRYPVLGLAREQSFYIETDAAATCSYQIITSRTLTGGQVVLSSGTLGTSACDIVQLTGPLAYAYPRVKTLNSTANAVVVELYGN